MSETGDNQDILLNLMKNSVIGKDVLNMASTIKSSLAPIFGQGRKQRSMVAVLNNSVNNGRQPIRLNPFLQL